MSGGGKASMPEAIAKLLANEAQDRRQLRSWLPMQHGGQLDNQRSHAVVDALYAALARAVEALDALEERAETAEARVAELEAAAEKRADGYWHTVTVGQERMNAIVEQRDEARRALAESRGEVGRLRGKLNEAGGLLPSLRTDFMLYRRERDDEIAAEQQARAAAEAEVAVLRKAVGDGFQGAYRDGWADGQENMPHPCEACSRDECDGCTDPAFVKGRAHQATTPEPVEG